MEDDTLESRAAWYDSDDDKLTVSLSATSRLRKLRKTEDEDLISGRLYTHRLRQQFVRIYPLPEWALFTTQSHNNSDSDDEDQLPSTDPLSILFQSSAPLTQRPTTTLPDDRISVKSLSPIENPTFDVIPVVLHFHSAHPLLLAAYTDHTLRIHSIDGKQNPIATSLRLPRRKIGSCQFHPTKNVVYVTALRRRGLYIWDLDSGNVRHIRRLIGEHDISGGVEWHNVRVSSNGVLLGVLGDVGWLYLLSAENGQYLGGCRVDGSIADYIFAADGATVIIISVSGEVWEFNTQTQLVTNRWRDEGGVSLTRVAISPDDRFLAIGSFSGIITIYDRMRNEKAPVRTLYNLTTPISTLAFSPDGQMLVMASNGKKDQLRVVHIPSLKVFPNWPTVSTPVGQVRCLALGENGYLVVGRKKGIVIWKVLGA